MSEISINLSNHNFENGLKLFCDDKLKIKNKTFIFAKNGSGKSTLAKIIKDQKQDNYDVQIFNGFDSLIAEHGNLDAFALAVGAGENEEIIKAKSEKIVKNSKMLETINQQILKNDSSEENLFSELQKSMINLNSSEDILKKFYTNSARTVTDIVPAIVENARDYNARNFQREIDKAKLLQDVEVKQLQQVLKTERKTANKIDFKNSNFEKYLQSVNEILTSKIEEEIIVTRIGQDGAKRKFAEQGFKIYKNTHNEICAFCGNKIEDDKLKELKHYFDADKVKALRERISKGKDVINSEIDKLNNLEIISTNFYPSLVDSASKMKENLDFAIKQQIKDFWNILLKALQEKDIYEISEELVVTSPNNLYFSAYNNLVDKNDEFTQNFKEKQNDARSRLRYHEIKLLLDKDNYFVKEVEKENLQKIKDDNQKKFDEQQELARKINFEIDTLKNEIESLKPRAEKIAIKHINEKLKLNVPWELDFAEDEQTGYYNVVQDGKHRSVNLLSTGEKNIIAFLYFIEKLEEIKEEQSTKPKIIIFDDPMNSNDDTMQYLIITELQKLYSPDKYKNKFDTEKDYLIILTHNIHFYLNVQPHGNYKENKIDKNEDGTIKLNGAGNPKMIKVSKYDKNNFYRLQSGNFKLIKSETDDFKTNYDAIWCELQSLVDNNLRNSMLNSMRRIIETYIGFNSLDQDEFYKGNEQYLKLFNVNSHLAIGNISAESFTESAEELKQLFRQLFLDNNAEAHFKAHWKEASDE